MFFIKNFILLLFVLLLVLFQSCETKAETPYEWHERTQIYNVNIENVVIVVSDYENYLKILPFVDKMKVLSQRGQEAICYFEQYELSTTFWAQLKFKVVENTPDKFILSTIYLKGNAHPFKSQIIVEKISDIQTRVTSKIIVEFPGPKFVPDTIINHYINNFLKKSLENLQKRFEK